MALWLGMNPLVYLRTGGLEGRVVAEAIQQAAELRKKEIESIGVACANALGRMFRK
jgi:hypothetical protein